MSNLTKRALEASLKHLLLQKPLNKITISDLTDDCGISRMTFYYHFNDIHDLIEWSCEEEARKAIQGNKTYETWQEGFLSIFTAVKNNQPFVENVYQSVSREQLEQYLYRVVYDLLIGVVEEEAQGMDVSDADKQFIADFYKFSFVGLMLEWVRQGMQQDPKQIVMRLSMLIDGDIDRMLMKVRKAPPAPPLR
ncbi:MAG: TetR/AcrR family transcriptional regulator C-terminal domain-containing protein [Actinomycetaceae bacterium]|nr:TetR/AcrR family transcriptional regulator C-terminal domain-containing protein [Actinomycetaceae bacterium]MDY6082662.1 TetR/AcrR family transcriptional regulator C-terminal domain-containing protein [Actinomycetaceae bacterium]